MKIRCGCIVVMIYTRACASLCMPGEHLSLTLRCGNMLGWLACAESTINNRILGPGLELQVAVAEISSHVSGYHAYGDLMILEPD